MPHVSGCCATPQPLSQDADCEALPHLGNMPVTRESRETVHHVTF